MHENPSLLPASTLALIATFTLLALATPGCSDTLRGDTSSITLTDDVTTEANGSCASSCGGYGGNGCYCDAACETYGDCCPDACSQCGYDCALSGAVCAYGSSDCNPYVPDVIASANTIHRHGDIMGYHMGSYPDVSSSDHWQGIQRLPVIAGTGLDGRYLVVSSDHADFSRYAVVKMASRSTGGARLRSNRLSYGTNTWDVTPPSSDVVAYTGTISSLRRHASGIQTIGRYLLVPAEDNDDVYNAQAFFYDMANPLAPVHVWGYTLIHPDAGGGAIAKLDDGHYLMAIARYDADVLDFYLSSNPSITAPGWSLLDTWYKSEIQCAPGMDCSWGSYQAINLVTDATGTLYLVASHRTILGSNDWVDTFRLDISGNGTSTVTKVAKRNLVCSAGYPRQCDLLAAGGTYVDDNHQLMYYATEHDNDGPGGTVKMVEFRQERPTTSCTSLNNSWVDFFEHSSFDGRSLMLDYLDRGKRRTYNWNDLDNFNDRASSVRWCLPTGQRMRVYRHDSYGGGYYDLTGNGAVRSDSTLHDNDFSDGKDVGDNISSATW